MSSYNMPKYSKLKKSELKEICNSIGLCDSGTKRDMVLRINNYTSGEALATPPHAVSPQSEIMPPSPTRVLLSEQDRDYEESLRLDSARERDKYIKSVVDAAIAADVAAEASQRADEKQKYNLDRESLRRARINFFSSL